MNDLLNGGAKTFADARTRFEGVLMIAFEERIGGFLRRARQARDVQQGIQALVAVERTAVLLPLAQANQQLMPGTLGAQGDVSAQRTRVLRDALHGVLHRLQSGQVLLATVGSTAPFVGLLGTVWGIYHALTGIATAGQLTIERVAGPVGEALVMTAAGLAVALPAVLAFNVMGRVINRLEQELEGFAHDLREL